MAMAKLADSIRNRVPVFTRRRTPAATAQLA
jgi:hypothetical protein